MVSSDNPFEKLQGEEDQFDVIHEAILADGDLVRYSADRLPDDARYREKEREEKQTDEKLLEVQISILVIP